MAHLKKEVVKSGPRVARHLIACYYQCTVSRRIKQF